MPTFSVPRNEKGQVLLILILFLLFIAMLVIAGSRLLHSDRLQSRLQSGVIHPAYTINSCISTDTYATGCGQTLP